MLTMMLMLQLGYQVITTRYCADIVQARTHKKKRINKKWRKRYGMKEVPWKRILILENEKTIIMHPDILDGLRKKMKRVGLDDYI